MALAVPRIIKNKRAALEQALTGRFTDHHAARLEMLLTQHDQLTALIDQVTTGSTRPSRPCRPSRLRSRRRAAAPGGPTSAPDTAAGGAYLSAIQRLCEIPGIGPDIARSIIGEIGLDVTGVFGTAQRLCSWAKLSPRTVQSGATKRSGKTGKGNFYLKSGLGQAATGAAKTDTFLGERYRRLVKRMPKAKAKTAIARSILVIVFELLADPAKRYERPRPRPLRQAHGHPAPHQQTHRRTARPRLVGRPSPRSQPDTRQLNRVQPAAPPLPAKKPDSTATPPAAHPDRRPRTGDHRLGSAAARPVKIVIFRIVCP